MTTNYNVVLSIFVVSLIILAIIIYQVKKKKKGYDNYEIIQRVGVGDEKSGWLGRNKITGNPTHLFSSKESLLNAIWSTRI